MRNGKHTSHAKRLHREHTSHAKLPLVEFENGKTYEGEWLNGQPRKRRRRRHLPGDNPRQIFEVTDKHGGWEYPAFNSTRTLKQQQNGTGHGGCCSSSNRIAPDMEEINLNGRIVKAPKRRIVKAQRSGSTINKESEEKAKKEESRAAAAAAPNVLTATPPPTSSEPLKFSFTAASGGKFSFEVSGPEIGQVPRDCPALLLSLVQTLNDEMRKREEEMEAAMKKLEIFEKQQLEAENIVGTDRPSILEAVKKNLVRKSPQATRMVGILKDLKTGKFADAAKGFQKFLKVPDDWIPEKESEVPKLVEEVRRLADCAECAKVHVQVLEDMVGKGSEDLRGTLEITKRLADDLAALQSARRTGNDREEETRLEEQVKQTRQEIDDIGGWYYGCQNAPAVAWPEAEVKHDWGKYGQPMCEKCKRYKLDHSTISADFNYTLYEKSSAKTYPNGVRDKDREGKTIDDFLNMPQSKTTGMNKSEVVSLRFYSSPSFPAVTIPLRDPDRETQHPLAAITYCISTGIRKQLALNAEYRDAAVKEVIFWRGFSDLQISDDFQRYGGTEYAPMSTSTDPSVAVGYAVRTSKTDGALLMRIVTKNDLQRGMDMSWISMFPGEVERLLPPLTFMNPPEKSQVIEVDGFKLTVVEVQVTNSA
jgi:hypothetical protein